MANVICEVRFVDKCDWCGAEDNGLVGFYEGRLSLCYDCEEKFLEEENRRKKFAENLHELSDYHNCD